MTAQRPGPTSLLFDVFLVSQQAATALSTSLEGTGLGPVDYAIYSDLARQPGPVRPSELAERLSIRRSTLTGYLAAMGDRGHLRRVRNPRDGRSALVELTPDGRAAHRRAHAAATRTHDALEQTLGRTYDRVRRAVVDLSAALDVVNRTD